MRNKPKPDYVKMAMEDSEPIESGEDVEEYYYYVYEETDDDYEECDESANEDESIKDGEEEETQEDKKRKKGGKKRSAPKGKKDKKANPKKLARLEAIETEATTPQSSPKKRPVLLNTATK